jgi:hypothetical protein
VFLCESNLVVFVCDSDLCFVYDGDLVVFVCTSDLCLCVRVI